jgi:hypothetical protein
VGAVDSSATSVRRCSAIVSLVVAGNCAAACQLAGSEHRLAARFSFDGVTPASAAVVSERLRAPLTSVDLRAIESTARQELRIAFEHTRLQFIDAGTSAYRVSVVPQPGHGRSLPSAGESRAFGGIRGNGVVHFNIVALSALAYSDGASDRESIVHAIGRGIGRTAVHEFAHQILGPAGMDGKTDRFSYEHADLRVEHFYAQLHWGPAAATLQERIGLDRSR